MNNFQNQQHKTFSLDHLINDPRLSRLFSESSDSCAVQLWILQNNTDENIHNRIVYGRIVPHNYSNHTWSYSKEKTKNKTKVTQLNLYIDSNLCNLFLTSLCEGDNLALISEKLSLNSKSEFNELYGTVSLASANLAYKPVSYLLNRDAYDLNAYSSPHGSASAFSASIVQLDKPNLLLLNSCYDAEHIDIIIKKLNSDTGLSFNKTDEPRLGDIELLVFPTLNELEQDLLLIERNKDNNDLKIQLDASQLPDFSSFQFRLNLFNDGQIIYSSIAFATHIQEKIFEYDFQIDELIDTITDASEVEVYGYTESSNNTGILCCRWGVNYIREINLNGTILTDQYQPIKLDWLEKNTSPKHYSRIQAALTPIQTCPSFDSTVGNRNNDPWVITNRSLKSISKKIRTELQPSKSEGEFFLHREGTTNPSRLELVEWFQQLLNKHQNAQVMLFDPYFDITGLKLLNLHSNKNAEYLIFTSVPENFESFKEESSESYTSSNKGEQQRAKTLSQTLYHNREKLSRIKLRILGLRAETLHDRYILILDQSNKPLKGFHLSNSLQSVAEKYPLLITPIPYDTLLKVEKYASGLIHSIAEKQNNKSEDKNPYIQTIFDSSKITRPKLQNETLDFLNNPSAGNVLSRWTGEVSLSGLSGDTLKEQLTTLTLLQNNALDLSQTNGFVDCASKAPDDVNFFDEWIVISELLAHTPVSAVYNSTLSETPHFLENLKNYLYRYLQDTKLDNSKNTQVIDSELLTNSLNGLLKNSVALYHLTKQLKHAPLEWSEYYAITLLWQYAPEKLVILAEKLLDEEKLQSTKGLTCRRVVIGQTVEQMVMSAQINISEHQLTLLLNSVSPFLQWIGFKSIKEKIFQTEEVDLTLQFLSLLPEKHRLTFLAWIVSKLQDKSDRFTLLREKLIEKIFIELPDSLSAEETQDLIDILKNRAPNLIQANARIFEEIIYPLLQTKQVDYDCVSKLWLGDLVLELESKNTTYRSTFTHITSGKALNICAYLFANNTNPQDTFIESIKKTLKKSQKVVEQPLASTSNWSLWDDAITTAMWILIFTQWVKFYQLQNRVNTDVIEILITDARDIAMRQPMHEWEQYLDSPSSELAACLKEVEQLVKDTENKLTQFD
ncbi:hypothetical protein GX831_01890 [bacterium]|nr:hypothetical protein [bacterium]